MPTTAQIPASPGSRRLISALGGYGMVLPAFLLMVAIIAYPAVLSIIQTLTTGVDGRATGFTLAQYLFFFHDRLSMTNLLYTLRVGFIVLAVLLVVCFPIALYLRFSHSKLTSAVYILALFPLFVPTINLSFAMIRFTTTHGLLDTLLSRAGLVHYVTPYLRTSGTIIGLVWEGIPFTVLILNAAMVQVDDSLLESARDVGASIPQVFLRILLPLIKNAVIIILALQFLGILGSYTIPYLLGPAEPEMIGVFMERTYDQVHAPLQAQTQAVISFFIAAIAGILYVRTVASQQRRTEGR